MTENRFEVVMNEFDEVEYIMDKAMMEDRDFAEFIDFVEDVCKENEQLKAQLLSDEDSVCNICNHQYLVENEKYYVARCKKEHEECSKVDLQYCEDFELVRDYK